MAHIEIDATEFENIKDAMILFPQTARSAMSATLNRATDKMVTWIHEEVTNEYAVKRVGIKKTLDIEKSTVRKLEAVVTSTDRRIKLSGFPFKASGKMRIAKVKVKQGGFVKSKSNPPLFVGKANKTTGKREVFIRTPGESHDLSFGFTLSIPQMIANDEVYDKIALKTSYFIQEEFERELHYRLNRVAQKEGLI